jgi:hypothetical protein
MWAKCGCQPQVKSAPTQEKVAFSGFINPLTGELMILCNLIGQWIEDGEAPEDLNLLGNMVMNICFNNALNYFEIDIPDY